jgi:hypothetical protein
MTKMCSSKRLLGFLTILSLFLGLPLLGCGPSVTEVSGTVTFKDRRLTSGSVIFVGQDGESSSSAIAEDGSYRIEKAPIGLVRIAVASHPRVPPGLMKSPGQAAALREDPKDGTVKIPEKYEDHKTSGLDYTVERGSHTFNIDLEPGTSGQ